MENILVPVLDQNKIQEKANEAAMAGALKEVEDFYNSYNSPYRDAIKVSLRNKAVDSNFDIPNIVAVLNQKISQEIDMIANTAVSKTFIPLVKEFLTREDAKIKFSQILKKFIESVNFDHDEENIEDYTVEKIESHSASSLNNMFPVYQITNGKNGFELHFVIKEEKATLMCLPYGLTENKTYHDRTYETKQTMKISLDGGATLEMPFTKGILENEFVKFCARLVIGNNNIIFDTIEFDEDMFPRDHCHCD